MRPKEIQPSTEIGNKRRLALLTGVPASGKDFLLSKLKDIDPRVGSSIAVFNFGELMFEKLQQLKPKQAIRIVSRDELATKLDQTQVMELIHTVIEEIITAQPAVITSHVAYKQNGSIQINPDIDKYLQMSRYIFVWSDPKKIFQRRQSLERKREVESVDDIYIHQQIAYYATRTIAKTLGAGFVKINNRTDNVQNNLGILQNILGGI